MSVISVEKCIGLMVDIILGSLSKVYSMGELFTVMQVSGGFQLRCYCGIINTVN